MDYPERKISSHDKEKRLLTVLVPAYNEAATLPRLVKELNEMADMVIPAAGLHYDYEVEFLIVDDGSRDATRRVLEELHCENARLHYLCLSRNFGKENAIKAGMDYAHGDCVVLMDADLQHPAAVVADMLRQWEEGYDDVYGRRLSRSREPWLRRRLSEAYYKLLQRATHIDMLPNIGDFRLLDRRVVDALRGLQESRRNTKALLCWIGYSKKGVDYRERNRENGHSRFTYRRLFSLALEGLTGFTTAPLRFATILGMAVSLVAFIYILVILCKTLIWGETVQGYPTLMCVILFLGGCQLLAIGIIGEYIGRIFNESKHRPIYLADNYNGKRL